MALSKPPINATLAKPNLLDQTQVFIDKTRHYSSEARFSWVGWG